MLEEFSLNSSSLSRKSGQTGKKKQSTLAQLLDQPFPEVQKFSNQQRKSSSSPSRDRIQKMAGRGDLPEQKQSRLNDSREGSLKKPPRPTEKASKIAQFGSEVNRNKHPCFQQTEDLSYAPKGPERRSSREQPRRQQQRRPQPKEVQRRAPAQRVLKDVIRVDSKGRLRKEDMIVTLQDEMDISSYSGLMGTNRTFNLDSSLNLTNMSRGSRDSRCSRGSRGSRGSRDSRDSRGSRGASPGQGRYQRTLNSMERKSRAKENSFDNSYFDNSYDYMYDGVPRLSALEEFMCAGSRERKAGLSRPSAGKESGRKAQAVAQPGKRKKLSELK